MNPAIGPSQPSRPPKIRFAWLLQAPGKRANGIALLAFILFALSLTTPAGPFGLPDPSDSVITGLISLPVILFFYLCWGGITLNLFIILLINFLVYAFFGAIYLFFHFVANVEFNPASTIVNPDPSVVQATVAESPLIPGISLVSDFLLYLVPLWLWFLVSVHWFIRAVAHGLAQWLGNPAMKQVRSRRYWIRWAIAPALVLVLHGLWMTQLPMKAAFALQKPSLEKIADQAIAATSGEVIFEQHTPLGLASVFATYRLPLSQESKAVEPSEQAQYEKKAAENSVTSILLQAQWGYTGYVRDLSRQPGEITNTLFALTPYKVDDDLDNHNDNRIQSLYYLWDGWYSYQVQRDDYLPDI